MADYPSIDDFLDGRSFAVVGASTNRQKYGNMVLRVYVQNEMTVYPVNLRAEEIEGLTCYPDLASLPDQVHGVSIITPPKISEQVVTAGIEQGIEHFWLQPGAEFDGMDALAKEHKVNIIGHGPCILVRIGPPTPWEA